VFFLSIIPNCLLILISFQKKSQSRVVKFCQLKKVFAGNSAETVSADEADDSWLDEVPVDSDRQDLHSAEKVTQSFLDASSIVNPNAFEIVSLLADSEVSRTGSESNSTFTQLVPDGSKSTSFVLWPSSS